MSLRSLIMTADDFGMSRDVNEAVEAAHREGVLTCASLVVTGAAAEDAIRRARRMPGLGVGLHLALVAAPPASRPDSIRALMDPQGRGLSHEPNRVGAAMALSGEVRRQARREIGAQLDLFRRSGLALDHVDGHWHFHQHPSIVAALTDLAPEYGIRAVRVPYEPALASWRAGGRSGLVRRMVTAVGHQVLARGMRRQLRHARIAFNDWFFGMNDGGSFGTGRLLSYLDHLPAGTTEIGLHPATRRWSGPHAPPGHWKVEDELAALVSREVGEACRRPGVRLIRFADLPVDGAMS